MTTIEFYYLAICIGAMCLFAFALSYNAISWKSWKQSQTAKSSAAGAGEHVKPQEKLAA
ncbi:hypothetical protein [Hyphomicrobium sp. MC8b]|uniref:hypothetical protein n=1 Tax=unclassified Hyphomicrobium TaxID=2619925 RepID=UPI00391A079B